LQNFQGLPSQAGSTLLLKSDNGQFQLLRIGPAPAAGTQITPGLSSSGNTIRFQTVPAVSRFTGPPLALRKTIVTQQVKQKQNVILSSKIKQFRKKKFTKKKIINLSVYKNIFYKKYYRALFLKVDYVWQISCNRIVRKL
jgi:transcription initiation factor TFIID subunit 4